MTNPGQHAMLLCPPDFYDIEYVINPWMSLDNLVDHDLARLQWNELKATLEGLNVRIEILEPRKGLPDMVFTGDGGAVFGDTFVCSNFRHPERQPEAAHFKDWFESRNYKVKKLPGDVIFEGLGDVSINSGIGITAYGVRTSQEAIPYIKNMLHEVRWIASLELVDSRFFHIGVALQLLDESTGIYVPDAFSAAGRKEIERLPHSMIPVTDEDADRFAVNAVVVGRHLVTNYCSAPLRRILEKRNFIIHEVEVSEFLKSGGGTRCLVLPLAY